MLLLSLLGRSSTPKIIESDTKPTINIIVYVEEFIANSLRSHFFL